MKDILIDALGQQCPIPVVKAMKALEQMAEPGTLEVLVDNEIAVQNLSRFAESKGLRAVSQKLEEKKFSVKMAVADPAAVPAAEEAPACASDVRGDFVVAIGSDKMGSGDDELGTTLMKGFLYAVSQQERLPQAILFYNGGAKLTVEGSVSVEDLRSMEAQGVEILTCGTCLNFFGLADKLAVGSVTNMYVIVEKLTGAAKVVRP